MKYRIEKDSLGEMQVPEDAYYGAQTQRAVENFKISNLKFSEQFIQSLAIIKRNAAKVNFKLGLINKDVSDLIVNVTNEISNGNYSDEFVIDIFQTGSGTSTNMNMNEVIANIAAEKSGGQRGDKSIIHPNDHVNLGQSSNDVIPTAMHLALIQSIQSKLIPSLSMMADELNTKSNEFKDVIKTGRTHLQDATPITLGQEFHGYSGQITKGIEKLIDSNKWLSEVALGGTAVGTGINTHEQFAKLVCEEISSELGLEIKETDNHFQAQSTIDAVTATAGIIKSISLSIMKICNDIRWMGSGPRGGFGEIILPSVAPGSSIMPGKVNPVIAESFLQVCAQVYGNCSTVELSSQTGNFELNVMLPVCTHNILESVELISNSAVNFSEKCIRGLKASDEGPKTVDKGLSMVTALVPEIGYDLSAKIAQEAEKSGRTIAEVALEMTDLTEEKIKNILDPFKMINPGL
ncbi:MAG: class II fumarate hydratase [Dehalococcoidia bacterium]